MADLPNAAVKRIVAKAGGDLRISASAVGLAAAAAEAYLTRLGREAASRVQEANRKTIMDEDVEKARERLDGSSGMS